MATGPEHYKEAEKALKLVTEENDPAWYAVGIAKAQVHATLALAAATALNDADGGKPLRDHDAWCGLVGVESASK